MECKQNEWLEKQLAAQDSLWRKEAQEWIYPPYADWAAQHGLVFRVWVGPAPVGIYLQTLEACYAVLGNSLDPYEKAAVAKVAANWYGSG